MKADHPAVDLIYQKQLEKLGRLLDACEVLIPLFGPVKLIKDMPEITEFVEAARECGVDISDEKKEQISLAKELFVSLFNDGENELPVTMVLEGEGGNSILRVSLVDDPERIPSLCVLSEQFTRQTGYPYRLVRYRAVDQIDARDIEQCVMPVDPKSH